MSLFREMTELDKLLHEPARLAIMTALASCESADFTFLQSLTGLSKGNLSGHLSKLEGAGLVIIQKSFMGKIPNTNISLTQSGESAINEHWKKLEDMRKTAKKWKPGDVVITEKLYPVCSETKDSDDSEAKKSKYGI